MTIWLAGSQRVGRHGDATESDGGSESDDCFIKHLILPLGFKATTPDRR
jgi:hypothetical protein